MFLYGPGFSGAVENVVFSDDQTSASVTCVRTMSTPCGTLHFPAGSRIHLTKVKYVSSNDTIFPQSGGSITLIKEDA